MSTKSAPKTHSSEILRSRYQDLLKGTVPSQIASGLCNKSLLTKEELRKILSYEVDAKQHHELLDILSCRGIPMLTKYTSAIKSIRQQPSFANSESKLRETPSPGGGQGSLALQGSHRMDKECQGFPATSSIPLGNPGATNGAEGNALQKVQTGDGGSQVAKQGSPADDSCLHSGYDLVVVGSANLDFR